MNLCDNSRDGKELLESGYILKVELTEFADKLGEDYESKKVVSGRFLP